MAEGSGGSAWRPAPDDTPEGAVGHLAAPWRMPDGTRQRGLFAVVHP
ncbi:hypothetical protein [Actinoallomurus rhizosphaericola]|nr:hypothetical protein [Actinoallomurus rhizosphaericola]MCO5994841.1 hypothetical protein [Actinoallomurus rhizosphaericola]